jgi:hypothetical protein
LELCKLLLEEQRLKLVGLLTLADRTHDELLALTGVKPGVLARHLYELQESGLVGVVRREGVEYYIYNEARLRRWKQQLFSPAGAEITPQSAEETILGRYVRDGRLQSMPMQADRQAIVLDWLVQRFHPGVAYPEKAVNEILGGHQVDYATLRRHLIDAGLMVRAEGMYERVR